MEWNSVKKCFLKVIWVSFLVPEWFKTSFQKFLLLNDLHWNFECFFSSAKLFGTKSRAFLSSTEWFRTKVRSSECSSFLRNSSVISQKYWKNTHINKKTFLHLCWRQELMPAPGFFNFTKWNSTVKNRIPGSLSYGVPIENHYGVVSSTIHCSTCRNGLNVKKRSTSQNACIQIGEGIIGRVPPTLVCCHRFLGPPAIAAPSLPIS